MRYLIIVNQPINLFDRKTWKMSGKNKRQARIPFFQPFFHSSLVSFLLELHDSSGRERQEIDFVG